MKNIDFIVNLCNDFELAFLSTGLKPVRRDFGDGDLTGCMVTALAVSEHGNIEVVPASKGFLAWFRNEFALISRDVKRRQQAMQFFVDKYTEFDRHWWKTFISYCIHSYDGLATYPRQWLKRNCNEQICCNISPKTIGAAVGRMVQNNMFTIPAEEKTEYTKGNVFEFRERKKSSDLLVTR